MSVTYEEIIQMKKDQKITLPLARKDLKVIPYLLENDENIVTFILSNTKPQGVLFLTTKRLLYISSSIKILEKIASNQSGLKQFSLTLDKINAVNDQRGIAYSTLSVNDGAESHTFEKLTNSDMVKFRTFLDDMINSAKKNKSAPISSLSIPDEILKYKNLLDNGILTKEEFDLKKKELIDL